MSNETDLYMSLQQGEKPPPYTVNINQQSLPPTQTQAHTSAQPQMQTQACISVQPQMQSQACISVQPQMQSQACVSVQPQMQQQGYVSVQPQMQQQGYVSVQPQMQTQACVSVQPQMQPQGYVNAQPQMQLQGYANTQITTTTKDIHRSNSLRSAIPELPMCVAVLLCVVNIVAPGIGTIIAGIFVGCGCGNPGQSGNGRLGTFCINFWVGILQLAGCILLMGYFWSVMWGIAFVAVATEAEEAKNNANTVTMTATTTTTGAMQGGQPVAGPSVQMVTTAI